MVTESLVSAEVQWLEIMPERLSLNEAEYLFAPTSGSRTFEQIPLVHVMPCKGRFVTQDRR